MACHSSQKKKQKRKKKEASLKAVQIDSITSNMKLQPSPASPSPSEVYFCSHCTSHEETNLNLPIYNINLGFISSHFIEILGKTKHEPLPRASSWGLISKFCKDHLVMQFAWVSSGVHVQRFRASLIIVAILVSILNHKLTNVLVGQFPCFCPGLVPVNVLVKFTRHHLLS